MFEYIVTIGNDNYSFTCKIESEKFKRQQVKKLELKRQRGFWGNYRTGVELSTNY